MTDPDSDPGGQKHADPTDPQRWEGASVLQYYMLQVHRVVSFKKLIFLDCVLWVSFSLHSLVFSLLFSTCGEYGRSSCCNLLPSTLQVLLGATQSIYIYRVQSSNWRLPNYWPPTQSPHNECVLPPRGVHSRRRWGGGWGVNILEDARHWIGLLQ